MSVFCTRAAREGEAVLLYADLDEDEEFVRWEADDPDVMFDDPTSPVTFVRMPSDDVEITALTKKDTQKEGS